MKIQVKKNSQAPYSSTLVYFATHTPAVGKNKNFTAHISGVPKEALALIKDDLDNKAFQGKEKETLFYRNCNVLGYKNMLIVGMGEKSKFNGDTHRTMTAVALKCLKVNKVTDADLDLHSLASGSSKETPSVLENGAQGLHLANYSCAHYLSKKEESKPLHFNFIADDKANIKALEKQLEQALIVSDGINFSRWLGDAPGNLMTPDVLAKETQKKAKGTSLKITVWDKARIKKEKMGGLLGVSLGSAVDPRFIIMEYKGAAASKKPVCFVGKGLTFDSGGISIKPSPAMDEMKYDMCGGANVIGAVLTIARLKLKVNVIGLVPASENMPGPIANKPGDILTARNGKTVEVLNTDAEGRLILMDALSYACEQKPAVIFDAATLTGAIVIALHNIYTGVFTRDNKLMSRIQNAADTAGENVWPMPINDFHVSDMKGIYSDLQNISNHRGAGSSTAAAFLEQFVDSSIPWAHFDIAGTAWDLSSRSEYCPKKGASGAMIRTFVELAKSYS